LVANDETVELLADFLQTAIQHAHGIFAERIELGVELDAGNTIAEID